MYQEMLCEASKQEGASASIWGLRIDPSQPKTTFADGRVGAAGCRGVVVVVAVVFLVVVVNLQSGKSKSANGSAENNT